MATDLQDPDRIAAQSSTASNAANSANAATPPKKKKKKNKKKKKQGKYSKLVIEAVRKLGEKNGCSLVKIYNEAKKVSWFDQQNGRTYLKFSIKALLQNDSLVQVKGATNTCAGSFKLNRKKFEKRVVKKGSGKGQGGPATPIKNTKATTNTTKAKTIPKKKTNPKATPKKTLSRVGVVLKATAKKPNTTAKVTPKKASR